MKGIKKLSFDNKIAIVSTIIALLTVIVAAIGLIPQFKSSFRENEDKIHLAKNTSAKKLQSIMADLAEEYFNDIEVKIVDLKDGSKDIYISLYVYNDDKFDEESYILLAEKVYDMVFGNENDIEMVDFSVVSHDGEAKIAGLDKPLKMPISMLKFTRTSTLENKEIWVSKLINSNQNSKGDIITNEYNKSEIFKNIDISTYDLEKTHYSEDCDRFYDYEMLDLISNYDFSKDAE